MCLSSDPVLMLLQAFAEVFTRPTFSHVLLLVCGTLLASGRRTITAALGAVGQGKERHFTRLPPRPQSGGLVTILLEPDPFAVARQGFLGSQCTLHPAPGRHTRAALGQADRL